MKRKLESEHVHRVSAAALRGRLCALARPEDARILAWFFKTGPGEYGEGDRFIGVRVPALRRLAAEADGASERAVLALLRSRVHEERLLALIILVRRFARGGAADRARIHGLYLAHARWINNWDLVDLSAPQIVGDWLTNRDRSLLDRLATSPSLWERRIAIVATLALIRAGDYADTLRVADALLSDREDLIHKATGWMLREVAKRDRATVEAFLIPRCRTMPRTMLRYAIERFPEPLRQAYLSGAVAGAGRIERRARSVS